MDSERQLTFLSNARSYDFQLKIFNLTEIDVRIDFVEDCAYEIKRQLFEDQPYERQHELLRMARSAGLREDLFQA